MFTFIKSSFGLKILILLVLFCEMNQVDASNYDCKLFIGLMENDLSPAEFERAKKIMGLVNEVEGKAVFKKGSMEVVTLGLGKVDRLLGESIGEKIKSSKSQDSLSLIHI